MLSKSLSVVGVAEGVGNLRVLVVLRVILVLWELLGVV